MKEKLPDIPLPDILNVLSEDDLAKQIEDLSMSPDSHKIPARYVEQTIKFYQNKGKHDVAVVIVERIANASIDAGKSCKALYYLNRFYEIGKEE